MPNSKPKIVAVIQARMGSKRLPEKALLLLNGKTVIETIVERLKQAKEIDGIILSTSDSKENDVLADHATKIGLEVFRGSESDLVSRHLGALKKIDADVMIKVTADAPLVDPNLVDRMVKMYREQPGTVDFMTNCVPPTYPDGMDLDMTPRVVLEKLNSEATPFVKEYFAAHMMENPDKFRVANMKNDADLSSLRWTLDYPEDLTFIKKVFDHFGEKLFHLEDVMKLLREKPELIEINKNRVDTKIINNIRSAVYHDEKSTLS